MIEENNFLKIVYLLIIAQLLTVSVIILIPEIHITFYYLSLGINLGINFIIFYIFRKNKKSKMEKIKNFKFHQDLITLSNVFLFFVSYILYNWRN
jgi:O-antigen/teichoic acid export membrane protein